MAAGADVSGYAELEADGWAVRVGVELVLATGEGAFSALGLVASCEEDLVFFLGRFPDMTEGEP